jgi:NTE family protein
MTSPDKKKKVGIALGGGGSRGFAHLGVLAVLEDAGIPIDVIAGTSMGAVVGGLYARFRSIEDVSQRLQLVLKEHQSKASDLNVYPDDSKGDHFFDHVTKEIKQRLIINLSISRMALLPSSRLEEAIADLLDDCRIEELPVPFAAVASDLVSGKGVTIRRGPLREAIVASSSIPGFFPPVESNGLLLVDGEVTDLIPVDTCFDLGADIVIAVDVRRDLGLKSELRHTMDVLLRAARITNHRYAESALRRADYVIRPALQEVQWSEFDRFSEIVAAGEETARQSLSELKEVIRAANTSHWWRIWRKGLRPDRQKRESHSIAMETDQISSG